MLDIGLLKQQVAERFPKAGPNKCQEVARLVFEIAKRDAVLSADVLSSIPLSRKSFPAIKHFLVERRYPTLTEKGVKIGESFPSVDIDLRNCLQVQPKFGFAPENIYIEESVRKSDIADRFQKAFPLASVETISSYKSFCETVSFDSTDYNHRTKNVFIVKERFDFFKPCPCSSDVVPCGYHNVNLGFGCPYECTYCFLQNYTNAPGIVLPANLDDFFGAFRSYRKGIRVGSGETTDSLVFDHLTGFSERIVEFFREVPDTIFEFKTKSNNIDQILSIKSANNIAIGWSVNPEKIAESNEFYACSLDQRLEAARKCAAAGYKTAFHFDPIIYYSGWETDYEEVVRMIFDRVPKESIVWISLGTLRMTQRQKKIIENRFPENTILDAELLTGQDGKVRYHESLRIDIYQKMLAWIKGRSVNTPVYLCMEPAEVWKNVGLKWDWPGR